MKRSDLLWYIHEPELTCGTDCRLRFRNPWLILFA